MSCNRFIVAVLAGQLIIAIPYCWVLFSSWGPFSIFRTTFYQDNFYDLQARAMLHGHLYIPNGSIGLEGFIHGGHEYTYFGLFPSLLRIPIFLFTSSLDSKLTPLSILLSWIVTGIFASLLLWRIRVMTRGTSIVGRAEAVSYGALMATIMGGSVLVYLAATPYVFDEDLAWSVALTVGAIFALLGVLERPTKARVLGAGAIVLAANLNRTTTGWACVLAAILIAVWFRSGRSGDENRRWFVPVLLVGALPFAVGCVVNTLKFGIPIGLPVVDQVWSHINAHRKLFLRVNHNMEYGPQFIPATALAYLRPDGIRFTTVFPFITLPASPAPSVLGVIFDRRYRTASITASMPLLFLLSCWGTIAAFRRKRTLGAGLTRILILSSALAGIALLFWGYMANRYLADFVPFLVLASIVGLVDLWQRFGIRTHPRSRRLFSGGLLIAAVVSVFMNLGIAVTPTDEFSSPNALAYVSAQKTVSDFTGHPINGNVRLVSTLPPRAPADRLFIVGDCEGLYISNGEDFSTVPSQEYERASWIVVQRGPGFKEEFRIKFEHPQLTGSPPIPLVSAGSTDVAVETSSVPRSKRIKVTFVLTDPRYGGRSSPTEVIPGSTQNVVLVNDSAQHITTIRVGPQTVWSGSMVGGSRGISRFPRGYAEAIDGLIVLNKTDVRAPALCRSLLPRVRSQ